MRAFMRFLTTGFLVGLFSVEGTENVPRSGSLLVCPNHSATLDPPMVPAFLPRRDSWSMAKSEYFKKPLLRLIFRSYHSFPVVRHTADRAAIRRALDILRSGGALILYPEGTRVDSGVLSTPEPGAGFLAQRGACPVLPVALTGTQECLPKGSLWPRRVPVKVRFGQPFVVLVQRATGERVTHEEASDAIMLHIAELLPPEKRGAYADLDSLRGRLEGVTRPA